MTTTPYNPEIHHRHSIRLKGHDYAGGGMYFVTICAHRNAGNIFAETSVKEMVAREWESAVAAVGAGLVSAQKEGGHKARPYAIMPDHFHALIRMPRRADVGADTRPAPTLGDVICAFKSRVVHATIARVKAGEWPPFPGNIWHRNYYERIVRDEEAEQNIARYIRMNPWRCVTDFGGGLRGMGNPALWNAEKMGVLCSRNAPRPAGIPKAAAYLSGFHSPMEQEIFQKLLEYKKPVIWCPAWGVRAGLVSALPPAAMTALEDNRMLILEMTARDGDLASAEARNRFVLEQADRLWLPHVTPGGMLDRLVKELGIKNFE
ncbi:MAG: transposase [Terrimicrobiaceae bacterium]